MQTLGDIRRTLADACGIATRIHDGQGGERDVAEGTITALLAGFGLDTQSLPQAQSALQQHQAMVAAQVLPPTITAWQGRPTAIPLRLGVEAAGSPRGAAWLELEDGSNRHDLPISPVADQLLEDQRVANRDRTVCATHTVLLPADLPTGYHSLHLTTSGTTTSSHLIVAPDFLGLPPSVAGRRCWGYATQLYSVPSHRSWGIGDLADLRELARWSASDLGAQYILINPINAAGPGPTQEASPYLPTSRRYFNPIYLRIEELEEFGDLSPADRERCERLRAGTQQRTLGRGLIDRDTAWAAKREALQLIHSVPRDDHHDADYRSFVLREGEDLIRYATWSALAEVNGTNWPAWPQELREPTSPAVQTFQTERWADVEFHMWLQWLLDRQLAAVQRESKSLMALGVIHDLPVGVHPDGADTWADQEMYARTAGVGAPPDAFNQLGQNWAQHPWRPDQLARCGYAPFRRLMSNLLRHAGGVRIDHIIGLFRLWWIPDGEPATAGSYVSYDHEAFLGIAALEAQRSEALIIGEDLGTVPPGVQEFLSARGILGTSVLWFEEENGLPRDPAKWRQLCLASVTTHDLPPAASFVSGAHVDLREDLGLLPGPVDQEREREAQVLRRWTEQLRRTGVLGESTENAAFVEALYRYLAATPCALVSVALTDAVGDRHLHNVPGTSDSYPNWLRQIAGPDGEPLYLEDVIADPAAARLASVVADGLNIQQGRHATSSRV